MSNLRLSYLQKVGGGGGMFVQAIPPPEKVGGYIPPSPPPPGIYASAMWPWGPIYFYRQSGDVCFGCFTPCCWWVKTQNCPQMYRFLQAPPPPTHTHILSPLSLSRSHFIPPSLSPRPPRPFSPTLSICLPHLCPSLLFALFQWMSTSPLVTVYSISFILPLLSPLSSHCPSLLCLRLSHSIFFLHLSSLSLLRSQ